MASRMNAKTASRLRTVVERSLETNPRAALEVFMELFHAKKVTNHMDLLALARLHETNGNPFEAMRFYRKADTAALALLTQMPGGYRTHSDYPETIAAAEVAIGTRDEVTSALSRLSEENLPFSEYGPAEESSRECATDQFVKEAERCLHAGDRENALRLLKGIGQISDLTPDAKRDEKIGGLYMQLGDSAAAVEYYRRALQTARMLEEWNVVTRIRLILVRSGSKE